MGGLFDSVMSFHIAVRFDANRVETFVVDKTSTVREIAKQITVNSGVEGQLVFPSSHAKSGDILPPASRLEDITFLNFQTDVLEMWEHPGKLTLKLASYENGREVIKGNLLTPVDMDADFSALVSYFARVLNLSVSTEFVMQHIAIDGKTKWLLNANLASQKIESHSTIKITPLSVLPKVSEASLYENSIVRGWLWKRSFKKDKKTQKQKRYFVLVDIFLYYFRKENDSAPSGMIPLQYYTITKRIKKKKYGFLLNVTGEYFSQQTLTFKLQAETPEQLDIWFENVEKKCVNANNQRVFGVNLTEVVKRKSNSHDLIPDVVIGCCSNLLARGVKDEGIFRLSVQTLKLEQYRASIDTSRGPDYSKIEDCNELACLLKLYLRELPQPLIPASCFHELASAIKLPDKAKIVGLFTQHLNEIPPENLATLRFVIHCLRQVAANEATTKMNASNLSIVFGVVLFHSDAIELIEWSNSIVKILIEEDSILPPTQECTSAPQHAISQALHKQLTNPANLKHRSSQQFPPRGKGVSTSNLRGRDLHGSAPVLRGAGPSRANPQPRPRVEPRKKDGTPPPARPPSQPSSSSLPTKQTTPTVESIQASILEETRARKELELKVRRLFARVEALEVKVNK